FFIQLNSTIYYWKTTLYQNPVIQTNVSNTDTTINLCKSVKSVSFYFLDPDQHRLTQILPKVGINKITDFWNSALENY
ncbi:MAG: hypothetical protein MIO93_09290, partial [ANME-2 cluster archaeon]|nr:hypothetical protein [ANME-2 cluster archaeon]